MKRRSYKINVVILIMMNDDNNIIIIIMIYGDGSSTRFSLALPSGIY